MKKACKKPDGSSNLFSWKCSIPGKAGTPWAGGNYPVTITFTEKYPSACPSVKFPENFFHPNIYSSGKVCLSILNNWKPTTSLKQILLGLQTLLTDPNPDDPANGRAGRLCLQEKSTYNAEVRKMAKKYP